MIPDLEPYTTLDTELQFKPEDGIEEILQEWADSNFEIAALLDSYEEDLKTETDITRNLPTEPNNNNDNNNDAVPTSTTVPDKKLPDDAGGGGGQDAGGSDDGPPDDISAFYGHPLTAATAGHSEEDTHASAVALIHEYINLPALDRSGLKIGEKINSIYDIMRDDGAVATCKIDGGATSSAGNAGGNSCTDGGGDVSCGGVDGDHVMADPVTSDQVTVDYLQLLQTTLGSDVDRYFSRDGSVVSIADMTEDGCPVGVVEEVIEEICVEADCLESEADTNADLFPSIDTSESDRHAPVEVPIVKEIDANLELSMPVICDLNNEPAQLATAAPATPVAVTSNEAPTTSSPAKATTASSSSSRKSRESKQHAGEKYQDLPKNLVKALTEKILKRRNQQNGKSEEVQELEAAVSNLPVSTSTSTPCDVSAYTQESHAVSNTCNNPEYSETRVKVLESDLTILEDTAHVTSSQPVSAPLPTPLYSLSQPTNSLPAISLPAKPPPIPPPPVAETRQCINPLIPPHLTQAKPQCLASQASRTDCVQGEITKHPQFVRNNSVPCNPNQIQTVSSSINYVNDPATAHVYPPYFYPNYPGGYVFPAMQRPRPTGSADRDIMLERYIQQQNQFFTEHPGYHFPGPMKENYGMKSPDSGYSEACVSPKEQNQVQYKKADDQGTGDAGETCEAGETGGAESQGAKVSKRRRSAPAMYVKQYWHPAEKLMKPIVPKLDKDPAGYKYILETPISTNQRIEEDRMTYMNKGQYYGLTLEYNGERPIKSQMVKSVIMVVFRDDKNMEDERKAWEFWHSRQHSYKQRVIDIDTKNSTGVVPSAIEEIAFNGVAVRWNPKDSPVKVNVAIHCLSTDFSNQKGVKGLPMHVQIDTYENTKDSYPISRAYCQIKIFCDKGAERKTRDEERRKQCRVKPESGSGKVSRKRHEDVYHEPIERSEFYVMADLTSQAVLFSPKFEGDESNRASPLNIPSHDEDGSSSITSSGDHYDSTEDTVVPIKRPRTDSYSSSSYTPFSNILLYVREKHEVVFTAVMLRNPTLQGLLQAVEEKYKIPASQITNSYKRSKKGILVRMDDNIIRHYSHESTFVIELNRVGDNQESELILTEIDTS